MQLWTYGFQAMEMRPSLRSLWILQMLLRDMVHHLSKGKYPSPQALKARLFAYDLASFKERIPCYGTKGVGQKSSGIKSYLELTSHVRDGHMLQVFFRSLFALYAQSADDEEHRITTCRVRP